MIADVGFAVLLQRAEIDVVHDCAADSHVWYKQWVVDAARLYVAVHIACRTVCKEQRDGHI